MDNILFLLFISFILSPIPFLTIIISKIFFNKKFSNKAFWLSILFLFIISAFIVFIRLNTMYMPGDYEIKSPMEVINEILSLFMVPSYLVFIEKLSQDTEKLFLLKLKFF